MRSFLDALAGFFAWIIWVCGRVTREWRAKRHIRAIAGSEVRHFSRMENGGMRVEYFEHNVLVPSKTEIWTEHEWREHCRVARITPSHSYN